MKRIVLAAIVFVSIPAGIAFATAQIPDILHYGGERMSIFSNPLAQYLQKLDTRPERFFEGGSTACWRGYQAEWEIADGTLYLVKIRECHGDKTYDLKKLFGDRVKKGRVEADWYTGTLVAPRGKMTQYVHMGYESEYERYLYLRIEKGRLVSAEEKKER